MPRSNSQFCPCGCGGEVTHRFWGFSFNPDDPENHGDPIDGLACCEGYCTYLSQNNAALNFLYRTERINNAPKIHPQVG